MTRRMETRRCFRRLVRGAAGVTLWFGFACSSTSPGVAGASCPAGSGGAAAFRAPSLMTTGGGTKSVAELEPAMSAFEGSESSALGSGSDPCARIGARVDGGADGDGAAADGAPESDSF